MANNQVKPCIENQRFSDARAKKHILIFSMTYLPFVGGAEIAVKEITDRISNFEFDLITARLNKKLPPYERIDNVNVYRTGWGCFLDKYLFPLLAYFEAKKFHRQKNYQLVQAIMPFYAGLAALFFKWSYPPVKYLLTDQSGDSDWFVRLRTWFWYPIFKKIFTRADYIQVISRFLEKRSRKYGYQGIIEVVPNGVDLNKFSIFNFQFSINEFKKKLGIFPNEKVIITVSRLVKKNGIDDLIKAIKELGIRNQELGIKNQELRMTNKELGIKLLIIGRGKEENKLKRLTRKLNLENQVLFLGEIKHSELPKYLAVSDVFVRPSLSEGLGNVFLEAMAMNVPIIGTRAGGIPDFLVDGETGLFCSIRNSNDLARKINLLLSDEQLRQKLIINGRRLVEEKYDWNIIAEKMREIYSKLINYEIRK